MMGTAQEDPNEQPQHMVTIARPFAVSKYQLTFADWTPAPTTAIAAVMRTIDPTRTLAVRCSNGLMPGLSPIKLLV
jgi:hypothetical protein